MYPVHDICKNAQGKWEFILQRLDISTNRKESPCPACAGNTRYRFDDKEGRGTHHCSHCGASDGLHLIMKVKHCTAIQGAKMIADIISLPLAERTSKSEENP